MAGLVNRPLPTVPDDDDYVDPGFEEGEFEEDYENGVIEEITEVESCDEDDYLEPEPSAEAKPSLPPRQPTWGRKPPPPPGPTTDAPVCPPRHKPQPSQGQVLPPRRSSAPVPSEHDSVSRPGLPAPLPQQGEEGDYMPPGPTEEYSEIPGGVELNRSQSAPAPPQIPDDLYEPMADTTPDIPNMSSMQKEILEKKLTPSTRELPPTPKEHKAPNGFKMVAGLDTIIIKDAKGGLRRVAKDVFDPKSAKRDSNAPDPSLGDVRSKANMFEPKVAPPTPLRQPRTIIRDKVRGSTTSNTSNRSDSGVEMCDMRDIAPDSPSILHQTPSLRPPTVSTRPPTASTLPQTSFMRPPTASPVPVANRTLPPLPSDEITKVKSSPSARPLPSVPTSSPEVLSKYPWFFGNLERSKEESKINALGQNGAYLVRSSTRDPATPYTLSILYNSKIWRLHIRSRRDGKFAIGSEKIDEESFNSVPQLIEHHMQYNIILAGRHGERGETRLIKHPQQ